MVGNGLCSGPEFRLRKECRYHIQITVSTLCSICASALANIRPASPVERAAAIQCNDDNCFSLGVKAAVQAKFQTGQKKAYADNDQCKSQKLHRTNSRSDYSFLAHSLFGSAPILQIPRARSHALRSDGLRLFDALAQFKKPTIFGLKPVQIDDLRGWYPKIPCGVGRVSNHLDNATCLKRRTRTGTINRRQRTRSLWRSNDTCLLRLIASQNVKSGTEVGERHG